MPYTINGTPQNFAAPILANDTTFVPLGNVADALGAIVEWDNMTKVATIELDTRKVRVQANNPTVETPEGYKELQAAPYIENNTLWVPARFFQNILNCDLVVEGDHIQINRRF